VAGDAARRETIIAVNFGGCVIPTGLALYELLRLVAQGAPALLAVLVAGIVNIAVCYFLARPMQGVGILLPGLVPRHGVKWHDGKPFTAADVRCTWDLMADKAPDKLRLNPRKSSYDNLEAVTPNGDYEVTFRLRRPQPAFPMLLAGGVSVIYPCHVTAAQMRQHPIGTGPFEFVEFKPNESIEVTRNPDYWKPERPYLDGIEYTIIADQSTAKLAFESGKFDVTLPYDLTVPVFNEVRSQMSRAICELSPGMIPRHLLVNRDKPPFDDADLRRAMALSIDRTAFIDILSQGQGEIGGVLEPPPGGLWGMPPDQITTLPGYDPDVQKNRNQARQIMQKLGYGPDKPLNIKVTTRDWFVYRDPAVLLIDQLKQHAGSHTTLPWREMDSNFRFRARRNQEISRAGRNSRRGWNRRGQHQSIY
jgi:peptide/nickel transport system substrate-binding protein